MKKIWGTIIAFFTLLKTILLPFKNEGNKQIFVFMIFLLISSMFWFLQSLNNKSTVNVYIPLEYENVPQDIIFTEAPPQTIEVVLQDKGINLINYSLHRSSPIKIDFSKLTKRKGKTVIPHDKILSIVDEGLKSTSQLIDVYCDSLVLTFANKKGQKLPVKLNSEITISSNRIVKDAQIIKPSEVTIYADSSILSNIKYIETEKLYLHNLEDSAVVMVALKPIEGAKIEPNEVQVIIPVEDLILKRLTLPISPINFPSNISVITFPAKAEVEFMIPMTMFPDATSSDFELVVDYKQFKGNIDKLPLTLYKAPEFIQQMTITPDSVEYIIERKIDVPSL